MDKKVVTNDDLGNVYFYMWLIYLILFQKMANVLLRGYDGYMIWMNKTFRTRIVHGTL
jgi:hypothetical protein